jgi:hypothetical protein
MEQVQLSLDDRIANLQAIISVVEYEIALLLKQKEYHPIGFTISEDK